MIVLEILHGATAQRVHRILDGGGTATIGRAPQGTVVLSDFHLSGDHAQITQIGEHYVFRDLRSTNGSAIERAGQRIPVDAASRWELALADGDVLLLGNPADPVRIAVRIGDDAEEDLGDRLIASRSIMDLPAVAGQLETGDLADALRIYKALQPLGARLEPGAAIEAVVEATFQLLGRATHVAVLLRSESDRDRFASRWRASGPLPQRRGARAGGARARGRGLERGHGRIAGRAREPRRAAPRARRPRRRADGQRARGAVERVDHGRLDPLDPRRPAVARRGHHRPDPGRQPRVDRHVQRGRSRGGAPARGAGVARDRQRHAGAAAADRRGARARRERVPEAQGAEARSTTSSATRRR